MTTKANSSRSSGGGEDLSSHHQQQQQQQQTLQVETMLSEEITSHLRVTMYFAFSFVVAWSWYLMVLGISHAIIGESPVEDQLSFGDVPGPKKIVVLLMEYLLVCGGAAFLSHVITRYEQPGKRWTIGALTAVQFFPSPVFGGKLMAFLSQFDNLSTINRAVINLGASLLAALLASYVPKLGPPCSDFAKIVRETLGFGLGIAWNVLLGMLFAPDDLDAGHIIGLTGYLALVLLIAFRVAAEAAPGETEGNPTMIQRLWSLLSFAMNTACAFTLVAFCNAILQPGWVGDFGSLLLLLILAAVLSAAVAKFDPEKMDEDDDDDNDEYQMHGLDHIPCIMYLLIFIPCVWCCCPWLPALFILAGTNTLGVKSKWFEVTSMITGLAASIEACGMLTKLTDIIGSELGFCDEKHCHEPWMFVLVQFCLAVVTTCILIPFLSHVVPDFLLPDDSYPTSTSNYRDGVEYIPSDSISLLTPIPPPVQPILPPPQNSKYDSV
mmetsp:Transcript_33813/g.81363  ORF Transcript_33813/g.81363 Transcript_33813/m.81363 type:complete len:494 (+) Transcript_33813:67-1548(+)